MRLGEIIHAVPYEKREALPGKVVYIHPKHRWYTLEFVTEFMGKRGKYREAFFAEIPRAPMPRRFYPRKAGR